MTQAQRLPHLLALRAFESAARHQSFSRAAEELCVTQGAISRHVKNLESAFEIELFERRGRAVILSAEGRQLFERLSVGFGLIEEATRPLLQGRRSHVLRVNVLPTLGMYWLAPRLHQFSQLHPEIEVHLIMSIDPVRFVGGEVDVAVRVGQVTAVPSAAEGREPSGASGLARIDLEMVDDWKGVQAVPLFPDILVAVFNPDRVSAPPTLSDLSRGVLISTMTRASAWADWFAAGGMQVPETARQISFGHFFMSLQAALEGKGVAVLPEVLVERDLASGRLRRLFHEAPSAGSYHLLFRDKGFESRKVRVFRQWLGREASTYRQVRRQRDAATVRAPGSRGG
jgi:LysR family glycine cleavage system transcriptional activator